MSTTYTDHEKGQRAWGEWEVLTTSENFIVKRITVEPGKSLHLQTHNHRNEFWTVVKGVAEVVFGHNKLIMATNTSLFIPVKEFHKIANIGQEQLIFIEVQTGEKLQEDDIIHYNDNYEPID